MKFYRWCVVPLLAASSLLAQTSGTTTPKKRVRKATPAVTAQDVQSLRHAIAAQQQQIEQLRQDLQQRDQAAQQAQQQAQQAQQQLQQNQSAIAEAQQKAVDAQSVASQQKDDVSKLNNDMADVRTTLTNTAVGTLDEQKRMGALEALVGRFRFNGDVRVRGENFTQKGVADRNRARIRVRFGFDGKLNDDFLAGISLATGPLGDPTTTNETLTNVFDRKTIGLDRGWITYNPIAHKWLSITGGRFAYQWQRTSVTGDPDLNPEGFNEKFSFDLRGPVLKNFTVQGIELLYNESSGGQDSYALGGQASAKFQFGPWTAIPSFLTLKFNRPDAILQQNAFAVGATTTGSPANPATNPPTPVVGPFPTAGEGPGCAKAFGAPAFAPCIFAPNGMTNSTFIDAKGNAHFYSGYNYADFILNNTIKTGVARLPLNLLLEFEDNLDAAKHPLNAKGNVMAGLGSQNKEYGADFSIGQTKNKNDIQVGYAWVRQEQDSVLASFTESDQRAPTNILQNRIYGLWKIRNNAVASYTLWVGRTLNTNLENATRAAGVAVGAKEPTLYRHEFDLVYTF
ncbi:MAG: hypothetical protein NVS1B11_01940 [Terriglobales bacterium]